MQPKPQPVDSLQLFQAHFRQLLNPGHPLVRLADRLDWARFEAAFASCYSPDLGAPAKATRLMVGLQYLKYAFNESDESVVARWIENPYWQYFCGFTYMQHELPLDPSSLSRWRKRVGAERLELLLQESIALAVREKQLPPRDLARVTVDTTVQPKNIAHPTDSKLLHTAVRKLAQAAKLRGLRLRQSYLRVAKRAATKAGRYAHAKQFRRMRRELRRLRTWVGRLIRDITRKVKTPDVHLQEVLQRAERIRRQQPQDSHKIYSWHEPEVQCISKGKARQRYEFGQKVALAATNRSNWIVAARLLPGNPYDGHTLAATLSAVQSITGRAIRDAYVDKGYRGHGIPAADIENANTGSGDARGADSKNAAGNDPTPRVHIAGTRARNLSRGDRLRRRRRSAIEPKIGHLKSDHRVERCFLQGLPGDAINIVLAAAGSNLRKLLRRFVLALREWLEPLTPTRRQPPRNSPAAA